jgi:transposase
MRLVFGNENAPRLTAIGIDIGKNSFLVIGQDQRGAVVPRQKWSRGQVEARLANLPPCLIGGESRHRRSIPPHLPGPAPVPNQARRISLDGPPRW